MPQDLQSSLLSALYEFFNAEFDDKPSKEQELNRLLDVAISGTDNTREDVIAALRYNDRYRDYAKARRLRERGHR